MRMLTAEDFNEILREDSDDYNLYGSTLLIIGEKMLERDPNNSLNIHNLGIIYSRYFHNDSKAVEYYIKASELGNSKSMNNLGIFYRNNEDFNNSILWLTKSVEHGNLLAMKNLGHIYSSLNNTSESLKYFIMGLKHQDNSEYGTQLKSEILEKIDDMIQNQYKNSSYEVLNSIFKELSDNNIPLTENQQQIQRNFLCKLEKVFSDVMSDSCIICTNSLLNTHNSLYTNVCGHVFHYSCIKSLNDCPICRQKIIK